MRHSTLAIVLTACALAGCATPLSDRARSVQVHRQASTLLAQCKTLGPVTGTGQGAGTLDEGYAAALAGMREAAADKGADTVVILNVDRFMRSLYDRPTTMQGTALRCY